MIFIGGQTDEAMRNCDDALRKLQREKMDYKEKFEKAKERVATCDVSLWPCTMVLGKRYRVEFLSKSQRFMSRAVL